MGNERNSRLNWIDISKGVAMLLVLIGHSMRDEMRMVSPILDYLYRGIYIFHMTWFFWLSGYSYALSRSRNREPLQIAKKRLKTQLPYWIFYTLFIFAVFEGATFVPKLANILSGAGYSRIAFSGYIIQALQANNPWAYHLWFLLVLIIISTIVCLADHFTKGKHLSSVCAVLIVLSLILLVLRDSLSLGQWWRLVNYISLYLPVFCIGILMKDMEVSDTVAWIWGLLGLAYIVIRVAYFSDFSGNSLRVEGWTRFAVYCAADILLPGLMVLLAKLFDKAKPGRFFTFLGKESLYIYLFHQPFCCAFLGTVLYNKMHLPAIVVMLVCIAASLAVGYAFSMLRKSHKKDVAIQNTDNESRMSHSKRNMKSGVVLKLVTPMTSFITRTAIIYSLGNIYLGLNGLFTSMLQVLSLAELGFGSAIVFSMYKPIAQKDTVTVNALLNLYRNIYRIVGSVILGAGLVLVPFLPKLIHGSTPEGVNITILYLIRLADTSASYFLFSYRNSLMDASQRRGKIQTIQSYSKIVLCAVQVILLILFKNYYIFCLVIPVIQVGQNIAYWILSKKTFPQYRCEGELSKETKKDILKRVTGLFMFRLSHVLRNSFDSIILSAFLGLDVLAKYQNYFLIVTTVVGISSIFTDSTLASIGNSVAMESTKKNYRDFQSFQLLFMWVVGIICVGMSCLYQPFIRFWITEKNLFPNWLMFMFVVYFFTDRMGNICFQYRQARGLWWEDRARPIVDGITNLTLNFILVQYIGIAGVMLSTIICHVVLDSLWGSSILFKNYFTEEKQSHYLLRLVLFSAVTAAACAASYLLCSFIPEAGSNRLISLAYMIGRGAICVVVANAIFLPAYRFLPEFKQSVGVLKKFIKRS